MRIAYIAAGAAGMYCGSCLHDNTLAAALLDLGEDVVLVPTYTPIRTDEEDVSYRRVFFGGINVYLQQTLPLFRYTPQWFDRMLDHPALLNSLSKRSGSVDPTKLGAMTVSMLRGEEGNQRKELRKLADWLLNEVQPDVIHLSNVMFMGMARLFNRRFGPPIVCSLAGEDAFLERLTPPYYEQARSLLRERARDVDAFVSLNRYYADRMTAYLSVSPDKVHVIPHGLRLDGHGTRIAPVDGRPQVVGYLARVCHDKGLHVLAEACELLAADPATPRFELWVAGYLGAAERKYLDEIDRRAKAGQMAGRMRYHGELDRLEKIAFLRQLDVFSLPSVHPEAKGLPVLEAWANAVPAVLPAHGSFPEMVKDTGGGLLHEPANPRHLAERLAECLADPGRAAELGLAGQNAVRERYHAELMALRTRDLYLQLCQRQQTVSEVDQPATR